MDFIEIEDLVVRCVIGVRPEERRDRSNVEIGVRLGVPRRPPHAPDDVGSVWNYRTAAKAIIAHTERSTWVTVEALAEAIARICVVDHGARQVRVRVRKPGALRFARTVGVDIERVSADYPPESDRESIADEREAS